MFRYERKHHPVISRKAFATRMARSFAIASGMILLSLLIGVAGYHFTEDLPWIDAFVNAAMILGGMGPVDPVKTVSGKLFAGCYALYSGLALILIVGIIFGPVVHRLLHRFHVEVHQRD